ncbi:MAG: T9SS type A sorting domain-containing protein [Saprospiraceae bacterium]|nr:T9SS type A sorting domain-containing protein [Saprospiraceae bacterium]
MADYGYSVKQTSDGGFVMCGINNSNANINISLIKTDEFGIITGLDESNLDENISVFPNPASEKIMIGFPDNQISQMKKIQLYNTKGQIIRLVHSENSKITYIDVNGALSGFHIVEISDENGVLSKQKIMLTGK